MSADPFAEPRLFLRIVEAGSLRSVAEALATEPSTVGRRLSALEARLGVTLIRRSRVRSRPTEAGWRYYERMRPLLTEIDAAEADIAAARETPRGLLRVTAPVDFGTRFVAPVLRRLQAAHAGLEVDLALGSGFADLAEQGIDAAVRIGRLADSGLIALRLGEVPRVLVAAPAYLAARGRPGAPADLAAHDFVFYRRVRAVPTVTLTGPAGEAVEVPMRGRFTVNGLSAVRALVLDGAGLHVGPRWAFADDLAAGRLTALLPEWRLEAFPLHAVYPPGAWVPAKTRAFVDAMAAAWKAGPGR